LAKPAGDWALQAFVSGSTVKRKFDFTLSDVGEMRDISALGKNARRSVDKAGDTESSPSTNASPTISITVRRETKVGELEGQLVLVLQKKVDTFKTEKKLGITPDVALVKETMASYRRAIDALAAALAGDKTDLFATPL
jgi:hypothetical protein